MRFQPSLASIKVVHSAVWVLMVASILYVLYSGFSGSITILTYLAIGMVGAEIFVLSLNGWACPLTHMAQRVSPDWKDGDDIFLPVWLATRNKAIFSTLFAIGLILVVMRIVF